MMAQAQNSGSADPNPAKRQKLSNDSGGSQPSTGVTGDPYTDEQLDKWLVAKRSRDFATADAIRDELRGMGVDPEKVRPRDQVYQVSQETWSTHASDSKGGGGWNSGGGNTGGGWQGNSGSSNAAPASNDSQNNIQMMQMMMNMMQMMGNSQ